MQNPLGVGAQITQELNFLRNVYIAKFLKFIFVLDHYASVGLQLVTKSNHS